MRCVIDWIIYYNTTYITRGDPKITGIIFLNG